MKPLFLFLTLFFLVSLTGRLCDDKQENDQTESPSRKKRGVLITFGLTMLAKWLITGTTGYVLGRVQCEANCVSEWTSWSLCSAECGGGRMFRTRSVQWTSECSKLPGITCSKSLSEEANCNTQCQHGTRKPEGGGCNCNPGRKGRCCGQAVTCPYPGRPTHGSIVTATPAEYGSAADYSCDRGFYLRGETTLHCRADGTWDNDAPVCIAVVCGDPGKPKHGAKDGHIFRYPHSVSYTCFAGYTMQGSHTIHCDSNGAWSTVTPTCEACSSGFYKADTEHDSGCVQCPANMHTVTAASTSLQQCLCDEGYTGQPGGPCQEVRCGVLDPPEHGDMVTCDDSLHGVCNITCNEGYILSRGSPQRTCQEDGTWSGDDLSCAACPLNTYKSDVKSCLPCPRHSHTTDIAQSFTDCICDAGFRRGADSECVDINECAVNSGRGDCEDLCENTEGSYKCYCSIQGYIIDPLDPHTCIVKQTCRNLTSTDAPSHGGLVCHWFRQQNSQLCSVLCNDGYEFPVRSNYETCGPNTDFMWSHDIRGEIIEPCIEEFFPDVKLSADTNYFVRACHNLTQDEQDEVKREFAEMLLREKVCEKRGTKVCDMKNMGIICGETVTRRRRDLTLEEVAPVHLDLQIQALKLREKLTDCDGICSFLRIPASRCDALCEPTFKRFLRAAVMYSKRQLERLYANHNATRFVAANRTFDPSEEDPVEVSDVSVDCPEGMVFTGDLCVPCVRGTHVAEDKTQCVKCQPGFYQPLAKQYDCLPCPVGSTSRFTGASSCTACEAGFYGLYCNSTCSRCVHGTCNRVTGQCDCQSGWEGPSCEIDIPGCHAEGCYPGVVCEDIPAPGIGYSCGGCPHGYSGDGSFCVRDVAPTRVVTAAPNW